VARLLRRLGSLAVMQATGILPNSADENEAERMAHMSGTWKLLGKAEYPREAFGFMQLDDAIRGLRGAGTMPEEVLHTDESDPASQQSMLSRATIYRQVSMYGESIAILQ